MKKLSLILLAVMIGCQTKEQPTVVETSEDNKIVVYQVFTRLFGNQNETNKPWGTISENGVGKFNDFTDKSLKEIKDLGVTHIWYTGIPHHALINDYTSIGISNDDPDVVKGRAGSPYAVKDYYNVNPDLATDPKNRLQEFEELIKRTHQHQMKVIIDIVPNHIARRYEGKTNPDGVKDFGADDDNTVEYHKNNNFYYIPNQSFKVPFDHNYKPLGGEQHPLADGQFDEVPAKWTGNGSQEVQPSIHDWYETVKVNYGIRPDGSKDFDELPQGFEEKDYQAHYEFWQDKEVPDSWKKFKDIALYWIDKGVDGFRYDMAEMVPVEFWSYMNSHIKMKNKDAFLLAEIYNPNEYRNYIKLGKMDYLYDKVDLYDTLKAIIQGHGTTRAISDIYYKFEDIEHHLLHFLENHDEQRIASPEFAGNPFKALPAMVVSATLTTAPTMIYFGQEVGEPGAENAGFGQPSRTSIFDYIGVPHHQRWMNGGKFDGGQLTDDEKKLRDFYQRLLNLTLTQKAFSGNYEDLQYFNLDNNPQYHHKVYSFVRHKDNQKLLIVTNFDDNQHNISVKIPVELIKKLNINQGTTNLKELLFGNRKENLKVDSDGGVVTLTLGALESFVFEF